MSDTLAEMKPSIGKRIYAVILESMTVVPAIVKEKVIRETAEGIATSYLLDFGIQGKQSVPSTSLRGHIVVDSADSAYEVLCNHVEAAAKNWRNQQLTLAQNNVKAAVVNANKRFGPLPSPETPKTPTPESTGDDMSVQELMRLDAIEHAKELLDEAQNDVASSQPEPFRPASEASAASAKSLEKE